MKQYNIAFTDKAYTIAGAVNHTTDTLYLDHTVGTSYRAAVKGTSSTLAYTWVALGY